MLSYKLVFLFWESTLIPLGTATQAGYNLSGNANAIVWAPMNGIAVTMTALISRYLGSDKLDYCDILIKGCMKITIVILVFSSFRNCFRTANSEFLYIGTGCL